MEIGIDREIESFEANTLSCFCREPGARKAKLMADVNIVADDRTKVVCRKLPFPPGNRFECGILFRSDGKILG